jgi:hypothetical protein
MFKLRENMVQRDHAAGEVSWRPAVPLIPQDGCTGLRKLHPYLVIPAGVRANLEKADAA